MSKAVEQLRAARELLSDTARWTQRAYARDEAGEEVLSRGPYAVCWCAFGALRRQGAAEHDIAFACLRSAAASLFALTVPDVNDDLGHAAVLRSYDRAIELAEAQS